MEMKKEKEALLTLCMNVIVENFERYMFVYKSGNYELHYIFELLQRSMSVLLLKKLLRTDKFEKYMDFLLNPYIQEIDLENADIRNVAALLRRLAKIASTITSLTLPDTTYAYSSLPKLVSLLTNVESMKIRGRFIPEKTFRCIGKNCQNLKSLKLDCWGVTDKSIKALYVSNNKFSLFNNKISSERLVYLDLRCNSITREGVKYALKHSHGLLYLNHYDIVQAIYELHAKDIHNASSNLRKYNLQTLNIRSIQKYPVKFFELCGKLFPYLKRLDIQDKCPQAYVDALKEFPLLQEIILTTYESCNLSSFLQEKGSELKQLTIRYGTISLSSLLYSCPKLETLELYDCYPATINDILTSRCSLQYCKEFKLEGFWFTVDIHEQFVKCLLSCCPMLQNLTFRRVSYDEDFNTDLSKLITSSVKCIKTLKNLCFERTRIKLSALKRLVENASNLETITLEEFDLTENDIKYLKGLKPSVVYIDSSFSGRGRFL